MHARTVFHSLSDVFTSIRATRRACLPPSKTPVKNASTIAHASSCVTNPTGMHSTFASLCCRTSVTTSAVQHKPALHACVRVRRHCHPVRRVTQQDAARLWLAGDAPSDIVGIVGVIHRRCDVVRAVVVDGREGFGVVRLHVRTQGGFERDPTVVGGEVDGGERRCGGGHFCLWKQR